MLIEISLMTLNKAESANRPGLVKRKVKVKRGGKVFEQYRWVKSGTEEPAEEKPAVEGPTVDPTKKPPAIMGLNKPAESEKPDIVSGLKVGMTVDVMGQGGKVTDINSEHGTVSLDSGHTFAFGAINKFGKVKDETPKVEEKPVPKKVAKKLPKSKSLLLKDRAKSVEEATKIVKDAGWVFDKESDIFPNVKDYATPRIPIHAYTNDKGEIYGMSQYTIERDDENEPAIGALDYLEINTPMRGKGYGKKLMANILKDMVAKNCTEVRLTSLDHNSNKFYEAIGMESIDEGVYGGDKKWMKKFVKENT